MKNVHLSLMLATSICGFTWEAAGAAGQPSAKATAKVGNIAILDSTRLAYTPILRNVIKTPSQKDLFIGVSLECGLYTATKVDSLAGILDRAKAEASIEVRVVIDPGTEAERIAEPGPVNFAKRSQVLKAEFAGLLTDEDGNVCLSFDPVLGNVTINEECLRPETLELILDTMNANSFNFILADLTTGAHVVEVQAKIDSFIESTLDSGAKVKDAFGGDLDPTFAAGDTILTLDRGGKVRVGQIIVIDSEQLQVTAVKNDLGVSDPNGKHLTVVRAVNGTVEAAHAAGIRVYIVAGAEASASIGKGSMTVETVRLIKGEDILLD